MCVSVGASVCGCVCGCEGRWVCLCLWVCFSGYIYVWVWVCLCVGVCVWVSVCGGGRWVTASQPQHQGHLGPDHLFWGESLSCAHKMLSRSPALYPLDTSAVTTKNVFQYCQMSPRGAESVLAETHCSVS